MNLTLYVQSFGIHKRLFFAIRLKPRGKCFDRRHLTAVRRPRYAPLPRKKGEKFTWIVKRIRILPRESDRLILQETRLA